MDDISSASSSPISIALPRDPPPNPVTVASSSPHHQILTLALPIQPSAARDDCWSEGATSVLIDAWGERYLELSRGNLRQKQWQDVADVVSSRDDYSKPPKTDAQCKNRIDTLKKKYKAEKSKASASAWAFFQRLDFLLAPTLLKPSPSPAALNHNAVPKKQRTNFSHKRKPPPLPPSTPSSSTSDSFPPKPDAPPGKMRALARAILRFGEVYQRVESSKMEQSMEMERQRMEFSRELEEQRMRFFMKTQVELSQIKQRRRARRPPSSGSGAAGANNRHQRRRHGHQAMGNRNGDGNQSLM